MIMDGWRRWLCNWNSGVVVYINGGSSGSLNGWVNNKVIQCVRWLVSIRNRASLSLEIVHVGLALFQLSIQHANVFLCVSRRLDFNRFMLQLNGTLVSSNCKVGHCSLLRICGGYCILSITIRFTISNVPLDCSSITSHGAG